MSIIDKLLYRYSKTGKRNYSNLLSQWTFYSWLNTECRRLGVLRIWWKLTTTLGQSPPRSHNCHLEVDLKKKRLHSQTGLALSR
jgi:hypothetical protein